MTPTPSRPTSFVVELSPAQQEALARELHEGNYRPVEVPHAVAAGERPGCRVVLYRSGKCVAQGTEAADWIAFVLEPRILGRAAAGYENVLDPARAQPHAGVDESGKGDLLGPLVVAAAYVDANLAAQFDRLGVRDSKRISSDAAALRLAAELRRALGRRFAVVAIGPRAYNRLYAEMGNVNSILAWGHARAIENLLEAVPDCPRALSDQFGPVRQLRSTLLRKGRRIELEQRPHAESDPAVAAASVLARARFVEDLARLGRRFGFVPLKGASAAVEAAVVELVRRSGPAVLLDVAKCHFQTVDRVLAAAGFSRADLGELGRARSRPRPPVAHRPSHERPGDASS